MAKSQVVENIATALLGGVVTVIVNLYGASFGWNFVAGMFITSVALALGKLIAWKFG